MTREKTHETIQKNTNTTQIHELSGLIEPLPSH